MFVAEDSPPLITLERLRAHLGPLAARVDVDALSLCDSSNAVLLARAAAGAPSGTAIVCDRQTSGRGRRGRGWTATPQGSLCFSLLWRFPPAARLAGLSLAAGAAMARGLATCGIPQARLKWPNDLLLPVGGRWGKVGGVLIELDSSAAGLAAVIGIGINLAPPAGLADLEIPAAGLADLGPAPERHLLLAALLRELVTMLDRFAQEGFAPFLAAWSAQHAFAGQAVRLVQDDGSALVGVCRGVDVDGALLLDTPGGRQRILAGDLSLRPA